MMMRSFGTAEGFEAMTATAPTPGPSTSRRVGRGFERVANVAIFEGGEKIHLLLRFPLRITVVLVKEG